MLIFIMPVYSVASINRYPVIFKCFCGTFGIDKEAGKFDYITIPLFENAELLDNGKVVYEKEHFFEPEGEGTP